MNVESEFVESDSDFYDLEYYLGLEARYVSGAIESRTRNIIAACGDISGARMLDLGCGGGFMAQAFSERGAIATGIDYAKAGIRFGNQRYPDLDLRVGSAYDLTSIFEPKTFDVVTLLDVIEHMGDHDKLLANIRYVLKDSGRLVISTDEDDGVWERFPWNRIFSASNRFSRDGRAGRQIDRIEARRANKRRYHDSHINSIGMADLKALLHDKGFKVVGERVYPMVGVPARDLVLRLLPQRWRGNHQCIVAMKAPADA
ncbi:MAG TPA: class I SAM-dependent methyltransferase [Allosphingosinicella sp.]|nr:class I SAM-dependent methyltransferase [Allosphingosinicella sp.]